MLSLADVEDAAPPGDAAVVVMVVVLLPLPSPMTSMPGVLKRRACGRRT
jgi:hypothetical protein